MTRPKRAAHPRPVRIPRAPQVLRGGYDSDGSSISESDTAAAWSAAGVEHPHRSFEDALSEDVPLEDAHAPPKEAEPVQYPPAADPPAEPAEHDGDMHMDDPAYVQKLNTALTNLEQPLFEGSDHTVLAAVELVLGVQRKHSLNQTATETQFMVMQTLLPQPNNMCTFQQALDWLDLKGEHVWNRVDVCPCGYVAYRDAPAAMDPDNVRRLANATECPRPNCRLTRLGIDGKPRKVFRYLPLAVQIQALFNDPTFAARARLRQAQPDGADAVLDDLWDSPGWKKYVLDSGFAADEARNLVLSLCADGVNPFKGSVYSLWPIMLRIENLVATERSKQGNLLLWGIVSGSHTEDVKCDDADTRADATVRKSTKSLVGCLDILVDELLQAYTKDGVQVTDAADDKPFACRAMLLLAVADYPGLAKIHCMCEVGSYHACAFCTIQGTYKLSRMTYKGAANFTETPARTSAETKRRAIEIGTIATSAGRSRFSSEHGVTAFSPLLRLYYRDFHECMTIDVMHVVLAWVKGHLLPCLKGTRDPKARKKARPDPVDDEEDVEVKVHEGPRGDAVVAHMDVANVDDEANVAEATLALADFKLDQPAQDRIDEVYRRLPLPPDFANLSIRPCHHTGRMKAIDHLYFVELWGIYLLSHVPGPHTGVVIDWLHALRCITRRKVVRATLAASQDRLIAATISLEGVLPDTENPIVLHLCLHLAGCVALWGSLRGYWMFGYHTHIPPATRPTQYHTTTDDQHALAAILYYTTHQPLIHPGSSR